MRQPFDPRAGAAPVGTAAGAGVTAKLGAAAAGGFADGVSPPLMRGNLESWLDSWLDSWR
ncbi:MAG TPA: hypothetical protein PLR41_19345, partial [Alphaproteobacteria bacterium]|nr:hypothetical protein [Alphaproteobacteria bacterium]